MSSVRLPTKHGVLDNAKELDKSNIELGCPCYNRLRTIKSHVTFFCSIMVSKVPLPLRFV